MAGCTSGDRRIPVRQQCGGQQDLSEHNTSRAIQYLPQVALATTAVAVMPVVVVWWLHDSGVISSPWVSISLAIALSLVASVVGSAVWKRCGSGDVFFSELLLWGWLHRFRGERRLAKTVGRLGLRGSDAPLGVEDSNLERKSQLLREMAAALDAQDSYTDGHSRRVALHSAMVARKLGLERTDIAKIRTAAAMHDIGKLRIPIELLNKPGELSPEEFEVVKGHASAGADIVACMDDPEITAMVRHHHERFDGTGYPAGLEAERTPLGARIIAVADTFDALTSLRPYRKAIPHKQALEAIEAVSGTQLDPVVVRAFLRCYSANRAVLFWTLLAVSPQRAVAWIRGRTPGHTSFGSAATVAMPPALAAVVAATLGSSALGPARQPLRVADQTSIPVGVVPLPLRHSSPKRLTASHHLSLAHPAARHAILGVRVRRTHTSVGLASHVQRASSGGTSTSARSPSPPPTSGAPSGGAQKPSPSSGPGAGKPATPPPAAKAPPTPSGPAPTGSGGAGGGGGQGGGSGGRHGGHPGGKGHHGGGGKGHHPGGNGGHPGANGGQGGASGGGNGSGGSGGASGGGQGGGGSGQPLTKDECMNPGYANYGFSNQGQCVAYVERGPHP